MPEPDPRDDYVPEDEDLSIDRPPPPSSFADAVREAPLVAVAAAFVAGLVVSRMILLAVPQKASDCYVASQ
jgi:hypothetical protein